MSELILFWNMCGLNRGEESVLFSALTTAHIVLLIIRRVGGGGEVGNCRCVLLRVVVVVETESLISLAGGESQGARGSATDGQDRRRVTTEKSTSLSSRSSSDPVDFIVIEIPAEGRRGAKPIAWSAAAPPPASQQRSSVWPELSKQVLYTQL